MIFWDIYPLAVDFLDFVNTTYFAKKYMRISEDRSGNIRSGIVGDFWRWFFVRTNVAEFAKAKIVDF